MSAFTMHPRTSSRLRAALAGVGVLMAAGMFNCSADAASAASYRQTAGGAQADVLRSLDGIGAGAEPSDLATTGSTDFDDFLAAIVEDSADYWSTQMTGWTTTYGTAPWKPLSYTIIDSGEYVTSQCTDENGAQGIAGDPDVLEMFGIQASPAFFCPADMTVYLSSSWLYNNVWNAPTADGSVPGDFAVAYAVSHEVAHAVQFDLGITEPEGSTTVSPTELQADCLAGVWSNAKYYQNVLEADDISGAVAAAESVGDYEFLKPGHHGTPDERSAAFMVGYDTGDAAACTLDLPGSM